MIATMRGWMPLALLAGCHASGPLPILSDLQSDDVLVVALADREGRVTDVRTMTRHGPNTALSLSSDTRFYTFRLTPSDFAGEVVLASASITRADREPPSGFGACGRCMGRTGSAPQLVFPGDACPPPPWIPVKVWSFGPGGFRSVEADPPAAAAALAAVRVDFPGACACDPPEPEARQHVTFTPIGPAWAPESFEAFAQLASDGTIAAFSSGAVRIVAGDGTAAEAVRALGGPVLAAGALEDQGGASRFLVAADVGDAERTEAYFQLVRSDGGDIAVDPIAPSTLFGFVPRRMRRLAGEDRLYLAGTHLGDAGAAPAFASCTVDAGLTCTTPHRVQGCANDGPEHAIIDFAAIGGGGIVGITDHNSVVVLTTSGGEFTSSRCIDGAELPIEAGYRLSNLSTIGVLGEGLFLCGAVPIDPLEEAPVGEILIRAGATGPADVGASPFTLVDARIVRPYDRPNRCGDFFEEHQTGALRLGFTYHQGRYLRLDEAGTVELSVPITDVIRDGFVSRILSVTPSWRLLLGGALYDESGIGLSRQHEASDAPIVRIYGDPPPSDAAEVYEDLLYVGDQDRFLAVSAFDEHPMEWVTPDGALTQADHFDLYDDNTRDDVAVAITRDSTDGALVASGTVRGVGIGNNEPWIRRLSVETGERLQEIRTPSDTDKGPRQLVELSSGTFLYYDDVGNLFVILDGVVSPVPIGFDDPFTEEVETAPDGYRILAASAAGGIGWAVGTFGLILQVHPTPEGAVAERVALSRVDAPVDPFTSLTAVRAVCPDTVAIAGRDHLLLSRPGETKEVRFEDNGPREQLRRAVRGAPVALLGDPRAPIAVTEAGAVLQGDRLLGWAPFTGVREAALGGGRLLVAGRHGRIAQGVMESR